MGFHRTTAIQPDPSELQVISREQAAAEGKRVYFTGQACKHGHVAQRYVSTGGCLGCLNKWKHLTAKNPFSHDLVPFVPRKGLWRSKRLTLEQLGQLDTYLQTCIDAYTAHVLPAVCKACDGTRYVPVKGSAPPRWELCTACVEHAPSTADVPTGTAGHE